MHTVPSAAAHDKRRRGIAGDRRILASREWGRTWIDDTYKIRSRRKARKRIGRIIVFLVESFEEDRSWRGQFCPGRKTDNANFVRVDIPILGMSTYQANGLKSVVDGICGNAVAVSAKPVAENDRSYAVVVE